MACTACIVNFNGVHGVHGAYVGTPLERIELSSVTVEFKLRVSRLSSSLSSKFRRFVSLSSSFSSRNSFCTQIDSVVNSSLFHYDLLDISQKLDS